MHDAVEVLGAEHPMAAHFLSGYGDLPSKSELTLLTAILERVEKTTGLRFHNELLVARQGIPGPLGIMKEGKILIGTDFLREIEHNPEFIECGLLHEAAHFRHNDLEATERFAGLWTSVGTANTVTELFGRDSVGFTAAVKEIYGSTELFAEEVAIVGERIKHGIQVFPDFAALGKLEPMHLLNKLTTEPGIMQRISQLPLIDTEAKLMSLNHTRLYLYAPGFRELEIERMGKLGINESEVREYIGMMKEAFAAGGAETAISRHSVTKNEIAVVEQALAPLQPYAARYDEVRQFAQTHNQAMEHRADLHAAYYKGSPQRYNAILEDMHAVFGEAQPAISADGIQNHPSEAMRQKVTLNMMDEVLPLQRIQATTAMHQGASRPKTNLMRLLAETWEKTSGAQI